MNFARRLVVRPKRVGKWMRDLSSLASRERIQSYKDVAFKEGDKLLGFTVNRVTPVPELYLTSVELTHDQTSAQLVHIARADPNNVFSIGFPTIPQDSSGVSHVLEHISLCGSKNFPCRDPFFNMLCRSLATYMNAWTASDYTMYPFSTQNKRDYRNLLSVYLDAVLFPNLKELDFLQEGWRLEHDNPTDRSSPLAFKGVVWNEMKGTLSDADRLFSMRHQQALYSGTTYGYVSGGDPPEILSKLTVDGVRRFHQRHYHPTNSLIYTYGDIPLEEHLAVISEQGLNHFSKGERSAPIGCLQRWNAPRRIEETCAPDPMAQAGGEGQTRVSVGWALPFESPYQQLATRVLAMLLVDGPKAPMYKALIESQMGTDYSPNTGLDISTKEASFCVGLQGVANEMAGKVEEIVLETLEQTAKEGFEEERVQAILHQIEFSQRHQSADFGLNLGAYLMGPWTHGMDVRELLQLDSSVNQLKADLAQKDYFQQRIKTHLLNNSHRLTFTMAPSSQYLTDLQRHEDDQLNDLSNRLTAEDRERIYVQGQQLLAEQNKPVDPSSLPTLHLAEIDRTCMTVAKQRHDLSLSTGSVPLQICVQPTNGVCYLRVIFDTSAVPGPLKAFVPLLGSVLTSMGAGSRDYRDQSQAIKLYTGGLTANPVLVPVRGTLGAFTECLVVTGRALQRNVPAMLSLLADSLVAPNLGHEMTTRLLALHKMALAGMTNSLAESGHYYAVTKASAPLTPYHTMAETYGGLSQISFLQSVGDTALEECLDCMQAIVRAILNTSHVRCAINVDSDGVDEAERLVREFIGSLPPQGQPATQNTTITIPKSQSSLGTTQHLSLPLQVNFVARALIGAPSGHVDNMPLQILARLLQLKYLHKEIREKGGAYGAGLGMDGGVLRFYSYRDPDTENTLRTFSNAGHWVLQNGFSDKDIDDAKLGIFQKLDAPIGPGSRGMAEFVYGITDEQRQQDRDRLFAVTREELLVAAEKYLIGPERDWSTVIMGPPSDQ